MKALEAAYFKETDAVLHEPETTAESAEWELLAVPEENVIKHRTCYQMLRFHVHCFTEEPSTSTLAFLFSNFILFCVFLSCIVFCLQTLPELSAPLRPEMEDVWFNFEAGFSGIFTFEYLTRLWASQNTCAFVKGGMNLIDLMAILPFWIQLALGVQDANFQFLRIFRLVRIFRVFRVARFAKHLNIIIQTVSKSGDALLVLSFFLVLVLTVFSSLMWFAERGEWDDTLKCHVRKSVGEETCSPFQSVPQAYYWAITTMTTVGYGDVTGLTVTGRMISAVAMIAGVLVLALPVSVLGTTFLEVYSASRQDDNAEESETVFPEDIGCDEQAFRAAKQEFIDARVHMFNTMLQLKQHACEVFAQREQERSPEWCSGAHDVFLQRTCTSLEDTATSLLDRYMEVLEEIMSLDEGS